MKPKKDTKQLLFENMVKLNPDLKLTPKGRLLAKPKRLNEDFGPFNDAGEPLMTHQQYNAYSEPSEPEFDDRDDYDREQTFNDVVKGLEKHFNTILDHYGDREYTFLTTRETPDGDMMVWVDNNQVGAIGPDDKRFPEQHVEELDINELFQFFEPYRQYIITGSAAAKEMNDRAREAAADRHYANQERWATGGLGEGRYSGYERLDPPDDYYGDDGPYEPETPEVKTGEFRLHGSIENPNEYLYTVHAVVPDSEFENALYTAISTHEKNIWGKEQYPRRIGNEKTYGADFGNDDIPGIKQELSQYTNVKGVSEFIQAMDKVSGEMEQYEEDMDNYKGGGRSDNFREPDNDRDYNSSDPKNAWMDYINENKKKNKK